MRQSVSQMRLVVLGSSGATGRQVVSTALEHGHQVIAAVRRPGVFSETAQLREVVWADVCDRATLQRIVTGADAVVSTLGGAEKGPTTVCTDAVATLLPAMRAADVRRLVVVSAHGVAESRDRSLYAKAVWATVAPRMRDKVTMEMLITASDLDWTIVRPPALKDTTAVARYQVGTDVPIRLWSSIGRADLAGFLVGEAEQSHYVRAFPRIAR